MSGLQGWQCPVCGRGLAPHVDVCPCKGPTTPLPSIQPPYLPAIQPRYDHTIPKYTPPWEVTC